MIFLLSPSKTQDFTRSGYSDFTIPALLNQGEVLIDQLKTLSSEEISSLMKVSDKLAILNHQRFQDFHLPFDLENSKQALLAFKGTVYDGIDVDHYSEQDFQFAQDKMRILSGLYGILRPLDLIQPYRLEMGTKLATERGNNLYMFWNDRVTDSLNQDMAKESDKIVVNLASQEYFKVIQPKKLDGRILTISFKEEKKGVLKVIAVYAKKARGLMSNFIIKNRINTIDRMKEFSEAGYCYNQALSKEEHWIFSR